jgi:hypothetical protein
LKRFAEFDETAGQRPVSLEGLAPALDQEDAAGVDDHCAGADPRRLREFTNHGKNTSLYLSI